MPVLTAGVLNYSAVIEVMTRGVRMVVKQGKEVKKVESVRIEPKRKLKVIKRYGGLQAFLDAMLKKEGI